METEIITALAAVIVALIGALGWQQRRNGKNHNPNFETLELLIKQQIGLQGEANDKLDALGLSMKAIETTVQFCPTVQATRRGQ